MRVGIAAAVALRPRPQVVMVLTDGYTPWPSAAHPGVSVVVGLVGPEGLRGPVRVPAWARAVRVGGGGVMIVRDPSDRHQRTIRHPPPPLDE